MNMFTRNDTTPRARETWAKSIARLLAELERPEPLLRGFRRLYRRDVAAACASSLNEIRWVLVDEAVAVRPEAMARLRAFLTDGAGSPLYRDDAERARRAAREIAAAFVVPAGMHAAKETAPLEQHDHAAVAGGRA
jgi:hypothetical protein